MKKILDFIKDEEGAALAEYGLLGVLIAVACVLAITTVGENVNALMDDSAEKYPK